jgi:hypothetical protein
MHTICVIMRTQKALSEMKTFMADNFQPASVLFPEYFANHHDYTEGGPHLLEDKLSLGFHYLKIDYSRYYALQICLWMAIKVGRRNKKGQLFVRYDKDYTVPLSFVEENNLGFSNDIDYSKDIVVPVYKEIKRLEEIWSKLS